jgi:uncharacterized protein YndB with AHSA1/START domain
VTAAVESLLTVRRCIHIDARPERVWQEFESLERMQAWFGTGHALVTYEPRVGGWVELEVEAYDALRRFGGRITVFDPPRELTFEDDWLPPLNGMPEPIFITLRLTPVNTGTIVELIQHGFERIGERGVEVHRGHEGGWTIRQLEALRRIIEGA